VDIFVALDPSYYRHYNGQNGGPAGLLDAMKRALLKTYSSTPDISRNGQAVSIRFTDFVVDVVVGFQRQGGGYLIANSINQEWLSTNPKRHVELKTHNGNLVPIIKVLKSWNKSHSYLLRSFHIEVLALEVFTNVTINDFRLDSARRFSAASKSAGLITALPVPSFQRS
jgi:Second Messenger Oligonucleotide or Dinucleotide Synthetase domain